ncbi:hypothetical protein JC2156_12870 [Weissella koreensis KCTC 3621]|uniref:ComF family protein n=1 Tax=Weissella koreensis TaxID=165096 RepID=UPI00026F2A63|nr:phosphoribosyltransferase family protein [Weissella koreensis]EJF34447.1 hypothetical protein JC2156_12870 [Weissella koreensis KCTC 3621]
MNCEICKKQILRTWNVKQFIFGKTIELYDICNGCRKDFNEIGAIFCPGCGRKQMNSKLCSDCNLWKIKGYQIINNRAIYCYNQMMKQYFREYKFRGGYHLKSIFMGEIEKITDSRRTLIVIPIANDKLQKRGFNQSSGLISAQTKWIDGLKCQKHFKATQSKKTRYQRINTQQWFELNIDPNQIENKKITLIDDIYTTGRTLYHAADCLYQAGAKNVNSITLIR